MIQLLEEEKVEVEAQINTSVLKKIDVTNFPISRNAVKYSAIEYFNNKDIILQIIYKINKTSC